MNAQWATAAIAALGLIGNGCWTLVNLRIENKILRKFDEFRDWADARYVRKPEAAPSGWGVPHGISRPHA